jgi:hypothetical protein
MAITAHVAAKIAANKKSYCANARPQPPPASRASAISSRRPGSIRGGFISHYFGNGPIHRKVAGLDLPQRAWIRVAMNRNAKLGFYFGYDLSTLKKLHERRAPAVRKRIYPVLPVVLDESPDGHGPHRARMPRAP